MWGGRKVRLFKEELGLLWGFFRASLVAQRLKRLPGMPETQVWSLGQEDPLGKEMATHSSTLAWRIPWREEPGRLQSMGSQRVGCDWATSVTHSGASLKALIHKMNDSLILLNISNCQWLLPSLRFLLPFFFNQQLNETEAFLFLYWTMLKNCVIVT